MSQTDVPELPSKRPGYVRLGKSGLKVSKIILGCMTYGSTDWAGWLLDEETAYKHIKYAYDAGINTFDTANVYSNGLSEEILGKAIKKLHLPREEIVVMTKFTGVCGRTHGEKYYDPFAADELGYVNQWGGSRKHIFDTVKASLKRLQLDYIDVLQGESSLFDWSDIFTMCTCHKEVMEALHDVVKAGYVRYIGMSSCYAWEFHAMQNYAINNRLTPFISMQNHYSLIYREEEREMIPTLKVRSTVPSPFDTIHPSGNLPSARALQYFGVSSIPWSPLGRGLLCRPFDKLKDSKRGETDWFLRVYDDIPALEQIINRVEEIAKKHQVSMAQVATAWEFSKDVVAAPIVGTTSLENLKDILEGVYLKLTEEEVKYLEEPYKPMQIIGH
ncbi:uncharacterized protein FIBRA_08197 [Fibroporia radiculosa]|uniref:NADP-dependent oxidoreductase domain-containing protein n=1 Tax=Fibroporia radiculosa TaxID=599839 RepID=J4GGS8_9APHY|nr:uncharacterized protein FIBRA_08197 [Fibroporia radiculosa]CCM05958.1 predicted protein [Fibroporia radiculosa]